MEFNNDSAKVVSESYLTYLYAKLKNKLKQDNLSKLTRQAIERIDMSNLEAIIVNKLPAVGKPNVVYLIQPAKQNPESHSYDEYLYVSKGRYEYVGDSDLDQFPDNEYLHFHRNKSVIDGFSEDSDGKLLYKGKAIGSASGSGGSGGDSGGDSGGGDSGGGDSGGSGGSGGGSGDSGGSGGDSGGSGGGNMSAGDLNDIIDDIWGDL